MAAHLLDGIVLGLTFVVGWYVWCLVRDRGIRGPDKHLLGMAVVDRRTGAKPPFRRGLLRGAAKWLLLAQLAVPALLVLDYLDRTARALDVVPDRYLSAASATLAVALQTALLLVTSCWLLWDRERRQLWDTLAGTLVVRDHASPSVRPRRSGP